MLGGDAFPSAFKRVDDKLHPIPFFDFLEPDDLTEAVKWFGRVIEDIRHHMAFAAIETIGHIVLLLPHRAHLALHVRILRNVGQLLELINAHDDSQPLGSGNFLGQLSFS